MASCGASYDAASVTLNYVLTLSVQGSASHAMPLILRDIGTVTAVKPAAVRNLYEITVEQKQMILTLVKSAGR